MKRIIFKLALIVQILSTIVWTNQRALDTWSNYQGWSLWQSNTSCTFLNSMCTTLSSSTLANESFDYDNESKYWNNGSSKSISLSKVSGGIINLYQNSKFNITSHPTCFWNITTSISSPVTIQVNRSVSNYEDISISIYDGSTLKNTIQNNLSNWKDSSTSISVQETNLIVVKVKRLNSNSKYTIEISQNSSTSKYTFPLITLLLFLFFVLITIVGWTVWFIFVIMYLLNKSRINPQEVPSREIRTLHINKALSAMKSGKYRDIIIRFEEEKWVICLENFTSDSQIHLINECSHYFHSDCLSAWFHSMRLSQQLKCPLCSRPVSHERKSESPNPVVPMNREAMDEYTSQLNLNG